MTQFTATIDVALGAGNDEAFVVETTTAQAVRVQSESTGQPYDVDITTAQFHPNPGGYGANNYTTCLPDGAQTITDTNQHDLGTAVVDESVAVVITNNSGSEVKFTGSISFLGQGADRTVANFLSAGTGDRPTAVLDGEVIVNAASISQNTLVDRTDTYGSGSTQAHNVSVSTDTPIEATAFPANDPGNDHGYSVDSIFYDQSAGEVEVRVTETESAGGGDGRLLVWERGT